MDRAADADGSASTGFGRPAAKQPAARTTLEPPEVDETLARLDEAHAVRAALDAIAEPAARLLDRFFCRDESYRTIGEALEIARRHDRQPDLALPRKLTIELEGRNANACRVWSMIDDRLRRRADRGAPAAPAAGRRRLGCRRRRSCRGARASSTTIVARAEPDAEFRARLVADLEAALEAEGYGASPSVLAHVRIRLKSDG